MAKRQSAGPLLHRRRPAIEVFLVHPGGRYWAKKDEGAWSIPKGEFVVGDDPLETAKRELREETGFSVEADFTRLDPVRQVGNLRPGRLVADATPWDEIAGGVCWLFSFD